MKIAGHRADGALYLTVGAGFAVILRGDRVSPPVDESEIESMGPWTSPPEATTYEVRRETERQLGRAHVLPLHFFAMNPIHLDTLPATPVAAQRPDRRHQDIVKEEVVNLPAITDDKDQHPVSEIAKNAQDAKANDVPPFNVHEDRKKKRGELRDKIRVGLKSQRKVEDLLSDEEVSDDDLYAMAKALGMTGDERPGTVTLVDNATRFEALLASTAHARHLAAGGEHPFQYCMDNVVPAMEREGKAPDDPEAFCAYWKQEHGE